MSLSPKRAKKFTIKTVDQASKVYFAISTSWRRGTCEYKVGDALDMLRQAQAVTGVQPLLLKRLSLLSLDIVFNNQEQVA
jgi:hypothetical protein